MPNDYWQTPDYVYRWLDDIFHFNLDAAADDKNTKTVYYIGEEHDALKVDWRLFVHKTPRAFCNPPYSRNRQRSLWDWCKKFHEEGQAGALVVALLPLDVTAWVRDWVTGKAEVWIPDERIAHINPETGKPGERPRKGNMIAIYGPEARVGYMKFVHIPREVLVKNETYQRRC